MLRQVSQLLAGSFEVAATLPDGRDLGPCVETHRPHLVVLDITLPGPSGIELARILAAMPNAPKIVMLTVHADADYAREAFSVGALGYVVKPRLVCDLVPALRAALDGKRFLSPMPENPDLDGEALVP